MFVLHQILILTHRNCQKALIIWVAIKWNDDLNENPFLMHTIRFCFSSSLYNRNRCYLKCKQLFTIIFRELRWILLLFWVFHLLHLSFHCSKLADAGFEMSCGINQLKRTQLKWQTKIDNSSIAREREGGQINRRIVENILNNSKPDMTHITNATIAWSSFSPFVQIITCCSICNAKMRENPIYRFLSNETKMVENLCLFRCVCRNNWCGLYFSRSRFHGILKMPAGSQKAFKANLKQLNIG